MGGGVVPGPGLGELEAAPADDAESRRHLRRLEARRQHDHVRGPVMPVAGLEAAGVESADRCGHQLDVRASDRRVPAVVQEDPLAVGGIRRHTGREEIGPVLEARDDVVGHLLAVPVVDPVERALRMRPLGILAEEAQQPVAGPGASPRRAAWPVARATPPRPRPSARPRRSCGTGCSAARRAPRSRARDSPRSARVARSSGSSDGGARRSTSRRGWACRRRSPDSGSRARCRRPPRVARRSRRGCRAARGAPRSRCRSHRLRSPAPGAMRRPRGSLGARRATDPRPRPRSGGRRVAAGTAARASGGHRRGGTPPSGAPGDRPARARRSRASSPWLGASASDRPAIDVPFRPAPFIADLRARGGRCARTRRRARRCGAAAAGSGW